MRLITLSILFFSTFLKAQISQHWVNNFCCFDSLGPHTFSYPFGNFIDQDTIIIAFYEDGMLRYKKIDALTGVDILTTINLSDTVESPIYFGGGSALINDHLITAALKYNSNTGETKLFQNSVDRNFQTEWSSELSTSIIKISKPVKENTGTSYYESVFADSIKLFQHQLNGIQDWKATIHSANINTEKPPLIFLNSSNEPILLVKENDSTLFNSFLRLIKFNPTSGAILNDTTFSSTTGESHAFVQTGNTLRAAFINSSGQTISFIDIDLINLNVINTFNTNLTDFSSINKFAIDTITGNFYLKTNSNFYGFSILDTLIFNTAIPSSTNEIYDLGNICFDQLRNPVIAYSFFNALNNPVNSDLIVLNIDKTNGSILQSAEYNDTRNTNDNFINQYFFNNNFYSVFANNFDNFAILQEETQIGVIKFSIQPVAIEELYSSDNAIVVFPNPVKKDVTIRIHSDATVFGYMLFNNELMLLEKGNLKDDGIISIDKYSSGLYFLRIISNNGTYSIQKIIKQ